MSHASWSGSVFEDDLSILLPPPAKGWDVPPCLVDEVLGIELRDLTHTRQAVCRSSHLPSHTQLTCAPVLDLAKILPLGMQTVLSMLIADAAPSPVGAWRSPCAHRSLSGCLHLTLPRTQRATPEPQLHSFNSGSFLCSLVCL